MYNNPLTFILCKKIQGSALWKCLGVISDRMTELMAVVRMLGRRIRPPNAVFAL